MPQLTLRYKGKVLPIKYKHMVLELYPINIGQTVTIGRNDSNDIVIDNIAVSGRHARIDSVAATFVLTDLESTNGTFVNEQLISTHGLRDNDVILIGKHELIFDRSDFERKPTAQDEDIQNDKTRHLDTAEYRELINKVKGVAADIPPSATTQVNPDEGESFFSRLLRKIFG